jgi:hypothetical protein
MRVRILCGQLFASISKELVRVVLCDPALALKAKQLLDDYVL